MNRFLNFILYIDTHFTRGVFWLSGILFFGVLIYWGWQYSSQILLYNAVAGQGPLDFLAYHSNSELKDLWTTPGIVPHLDKSFIIKLYSIITNWSSINGEQILKVLTFFEPVTYAFAVIYFLKTIFPKAPSVAIFIITLLLVASPIQSPNLARWSSPVYIGLYYVYCDTFRIIGITLLLRQKFILSGFVLGFGFMLHPIMGAFGIIFCYGSQLIQFKNCNIKKYLFSILVCGLICLYWIISQNLILADSEPFLSNQDWVNITKMGSYHFYPLEIGVFTDMGNRYVLPFLSLMLLFIHFLINHKEKLGAFKFKVLSSGQLILFLVCSSGVIISIFFNEPGLIKLALHRSSDILIFIASAFVIKGFLDNILLRQAFIIRFLSLGMLLISYLTGSGIPISLAFLYLAMMNVIHIEKFVKDRIGQQFVLPLRMTLSVMALFVLCLYFGLNMPSYSDYFWTILAVLCVVLLITILGFVRKPIKSMQRLSIQLFLVVVCLSSIWFSQNQPVPDSSLARSKSFKEVQIWAREKTETNSLFLIDPSLTYGWVGFSERATFGNIRDWLIWSVAYSQNAKAFEEGNKRLNFFGLNLSDYIGFKVPINGYAKMSNDVANIYYGFKNRELIYMQRVFGINFFVIEKQYQKQNYSFEPVFENKHFVVYKT